MKYLIFLAFFSSSIASAALVCTPNGCEIQDEFSYTASGLCKIHKSFAFISETHVYTENTDGPIAMMQALQKAIVSCKKIGKSHGDKTPEFKLIKMAKNTLNNKSDSYASR